MPGTASARSDVKYKEFVPELRSTLDTANLPVQFKITGPVGFLNDLAGAFAGIDGILLSVALLVVPYLVSSMRSEAEL